MKHKKQQETFEQTESTESTEQINNQNNQEEIQTNTNTEKKSKVKDYFIEKSYKIKLVDKNGIEYPFPACIICGETRPEYLWRRVDTTKSIVKKGMCIDCIMKAAEKIFATERKYRPSDSEDD